MLFLSNFLPKRAKIMSKNVKSNNKNTKKSASKAKKSTRNNYKIESLEPRLIMEA